MTDEAFNTICDECNQATAQAEAERAAARAEADRKYRLAMAEIQGKWHDAFKAHQEATERAYVEWQQRQPVQIERPARLGVQYDEVRTAQLTSEWRIVLDSRKGSARKSRKKMSGVI